MWGQITGLLAKLNWFFCRSDHINIHFFIIVHLRIQKRNSNVYVQSFLMELSCKPFGLKSPAA